MTTLAEEMKAHALESQRFSRKHLVLELDFSEASVQELENQADSVTFALRGGKSQENLDMLERIWGAYIGESLRRATKGEWFEETTESGRRIGLRGPAGSVFPHEQVRHRLVGSKADSLLVFFQRARETLRSESPPSGS